MLNIENIVSDVMLFPGCNVAVYTRDADNSTEAANKVIKHCESNGIKWAYSRGSSCLIAGGSGWIFFFSLEDIDISVGGEFYTSHIDNEARITMSQYEMILSRNTQLMPEEISAYPEWSAFYRKQYEQPIKDICILVRENPDFFGNPESGYYPMPVVLDKLSELVKAKKSAKPENASTFEGHILRPGMVFEHVGSHQLFTIHKQERLYALKNESSVNYGSVLPEKIGDIFRGNQECFKLISVPVEKGMVYEVGDRFMRTLYMQKYVLTCGGDGRYALINNANGDYYAAPSAIEDVFSDNEDSFSLLVN